jgi:hypothetical protein
MDSSPGDSWLLSTLQQNRLLGVTATLNKYSSCRLSYDLELVKPQAELFEVSDTSLHQPAQHAQA